MFGHICHLPAASRCLSVLKMQSALITSDMEEQEKGEGGETVEEGAVSGLVCLRVGAMR